MAPLPHNNTGILYLDYTTCLHDHVMACRFDSPNTPADAMGAISDFLTALGTEWLYLLTVRGARWQQKNTSVSFPVAWTGAATYGSGAGTEDRSASFISFPGRSAFGRRVRAEVFGCKFGVFSGKYRAFIAGDDALIAAQSVLGEAEGSFLAIDGNLANWKNYANLGENAYWRNQIR